MNALGASVPGMISVPDLQPTTLRHQGTGSTMELSKALPTSDVAEDFGSSDEVES